MQDTVTEKDAKETGGTEVLPHTQVVLDNAVQVAATAKAVATALLTHKEPAKTTTSYKYEECHTGNVHVFTVGGLQVFAGGKSYDAEFTTDSVDIIMDVGAGVVVPSILGNVRGLANVRAAIHAPTIIRLPWDDGWDAEYDREFWEILAHDLLEFAELPEFVQHPDGPQYARLLIACIGGHGRTGTALSILASLWGIVPDGEDPVKWVRQRYCKKAVENNRQLDYIEKMTGRKTTAVGSHTLYPTYTSTKYGTGSYGTTPATYENKGGKITNVEAKDGKLTESDEWGKWHSKYPAAPDDDATDEAWSKYLLELRALEEAEERELMNISGALSSEISFNDNDVEDEEELEELSRESLLNEEVEVDEYYTLADGTEVWDNGTFVYHKAFAGGPWLPRFMWVREGGHLVKRELSPIVLASLVNMGEKKEETPKTIITS